MPPGEQSSAKRAKVEHVATLVAVVLCVGFAVTSHVRCHVLAVTPDSAYYSIVARNLVRGDGYKTSFVLYHLAWYDSADHVPDLHGILQPFLLALGYSVARSEESWVYMKVGIVLLSLTGFVTYELGRFLFSWQVGLLACGLTLLSPQLFLTMIAGADDLGFVMFITMFIYSYLRGLQCDQSGWLALAGIAGGLAVLQKFLGVVLVTMAVPVLVVSRAPRMLRRVAQSAIVCLPVMLAICAYFARNAAVYGEWQFRSSVHMRVLIDHGEEAACALLQDPNLPGMLARSSGDLIWAISAGTVSAFMPSFWTDPYLLLLGWPAGVLIARSILLAILVVAGIIAAVRSRPNLAWTWILLACLSAGLVKVAWHYEARYFSMLIPITLVLFIGFFHDLWRSLHDRRSKLALFVIVCSLVGIAAPILSWPRLAATACLSSSGVQPWCRDTLSWLSKNTPDEAVVLTSDPTAVALNAGRRAVMLPAGGTGAIREVIKHYGVTWVLVSHMPPRPLTSRHLWEFLTAAEADREFEAGECTAFRIQSRDG